MDNNTDFKNATLEAIYWWNRDEDYYHKYFKKFDEIYHNKKLLPFFTAKVFEVFLRQYSIRRNIEKGYGKVDIFIEELFRLNFVEGVKKGKKEVVDEVSLKMKRGNITNNKEIRSLLSKVAFLINPSEFSLVDSLVKDSLWTIVKSEKIDKKNKLESYTEFLTQTNKQILVNKDVIRKQFQLLDNFKNTNAYLFFKENPKAFERRIYDKYLWIKKQNGNKNVREINNLHYLEFSTL